MTSDLSGAPADAGSSDARRNVEDVLPLLANQHVLVLFAGLPGDEDPGFLQVRFTLTGTLDEARFTRPGGAWSRSIRRCGLRSTSGTAGPPWPWSVARWPCPWMSGTGARSTRRIRPRLWSRYWTRIGSEVWTSLSLRPCVCPWSG